MRERKQTTKEEILLKWCLIRFPGGLRYGTCSNKNPHDLEQQRWNDSNIEKSSISPHSDLKPPNLATTDSTHHIKPITHANARCGHRQVSQTQSDVIPYITLTYINGNKRSPQQSTQDGGTNLACWKNKMQHKWQTQNAWKPITERGLHHYERKMMMEKQLRSRYTTTYRDANISNLLQVIWVEWKTIMQSDAFGARELNTYTASKPPWNSNPPIKSCPISLNSSYFGGSLKDGTTFFTFSNMCCARKGHIFQSVLCERGSHFPICVVR